MPTEEQTTSKTEGQEGETVEPEKPDFNQIANQAAAAHAKRLEKQLSKTFEDKFSALNSTLEKLAQSTQQAPPPKTKEKQEDPELNALKQEMEKLKNDASAQKQRADQAERQRRDEQTLNRVRSALSNGGCRQEALPIATDYIVRATNRIEYDDDGTALFKFRKSAKDDEILMPLEDGITAYLKSSEAAIFLPAPVSGNTGKAPTPKVARSATDGRPVWDKPASTDEERNERAKMLAEWAAQKYKQS